MTTTGIFTIHSFRIPFISYDEPIYLIPFGDVHRDAPGHAIERWREFLEWAKKKPRCYFLGMGDYHDMNSTSERLILENDHLHESTKKTLQNMYQNECDRFAKEIGFMKGRLIGMIEGNHFGRLPHGTTTQEMCRQLGTTYLGVMSVIRLTFEHKKRGISRSIDIVAHHGKGAARLLGGSLNRVQQMAEAVEADVFLMGHDHKKVVGMSTKLKVISISTGEGIRLEHRKQIFVRTGSFLRGYVDGEASYVADMAGNPTDLGVVKIEFTPKRERGGGTDITSIDYHVSI